jgi:hypothetical protein
LLWRGQRRGVAGGRAATRCRGGSPAPRRGSHDRWSCTSHSVDSLAVGPEPTAAPQIATTGRRRAAGRRHGPCVLHLLCDR